ncbi:Phosphate ABC transporter, periplasmic phosphate-binding protein PstS [Pseudonocardia sp. Ae168_Ps1]|uniref:phosphate ABC transporter substrate-binding protein PstS n=1 Tax=unclassified Pseudonocardia TaxID=2619320 RepID=UPI00094B348A|nr:MULTISPECIES: phosphate ABC transporter substrate-binding protein PstS [unclassified Pseudonocardia]OLL75335.1 Phosphate ABC transporter, periplasmic phosphate-binding protein PstS [Pseudonocardia sp. Ae150A_Ps1]OLL81330.1 Phosphate ABC transporter, periplasmic phosphate-binding protein PstS [Pseudonocardia sp. Ae168_Ps1]OLL84556.1 Phosphate ABC transporter, periplasmic phosphate-binding protein PstS [Pseudonocardia sp. Ae263_Ps1]OLL95424.1 Phosphate ABC transporter, periplasmic phosphate-bi
MKTKRRAPRARLAAVGVATTCALFVAGCGAANEGGGGGAAEGSGVTGSISGAGASSQQAAMQAWNAGFAEANPGATVNYQPVGSGGGRTQFVEGGVQFAGSDAYLKDDQLNQARQRCGGSVIEIPNYVSPIAVVYKLDGVPELNLAPATIAGIFKGEITTWNDPKIAADNPGAQLPATPVTPVHRSDESGTTENFTDFLNKAAADVWTDEGDGNWPVQGGEAAQGTSGVVGAVGAGNGTIGYADASQAGELGKANVKLGEQNVAPTAEAAAKILEESQRVEGQGDTSFAYELNRTATGGAYPVVLVSYLLACPQYPDQAQADVTKSFLNYVVSPEGQQTAAQNAGSAPISDALRGQITPVIDQITAAG